MEIKLVDGKITQKSGFSFKTFVDVLDTNVKYALIMYLLKDAGLELKADDSSLVLELSNEKRVTNFYSWLNEKRLYLQSKSVGVVEKI